MIRTLVIPQRDEISIQLPSSYVGKQVEVIVFTVEENEALSMADKRNIPFVVLHVEDKNFRFNRDEANGR